MASIPLSNTRVVAMPKGAATSYLSLSLQVLPLSVITVDENCSPATSFFNYPCLIAWRMLPSARTSPLAMEFTEWPTSNLF